VPTFLGQSAGSVAARDLRHGGHLRLAIVMPQRTRTGFGSGGTMLLSLHENRRWRLGIDTDVDGVCGQHRGAPSQATTTGSTNDVARQTWICRSVRTFDASAQRVYLCAAPRLCRHAGCRAASWLCAAPRICSAAPRICSAAESRTATWIYAAPTAATAECMAMAYGLVSAARPTATDTRARSTATPCRVAKRISYRKSANAGAAPWQHSDATRSARNLD
jgi:hypothetical protein